MMEAPGNGVRIGGTMATGCEEVWSMTLPSAVRRGLGEALLAHDGPVQSNDFLEFATETMRRLAPLEMVEACERLVQRQGSEVALLIRGLPVDPNLPPTPIGGAEHKPTHVSEAVLLGVAGRLGNPIAYRDEKDGALVQNVFPHPDDRASPSNASSEVSLDLHTEIAFVRDEPHWRTYEISPDFLLLLCLRPAPKGDACTRVVAANALLSSITLEERHILESPRFRLRAPYSFTRGGDKTRPWSDFVPLVHAGGMIAFDLACGVRASDEDSQRALDALRRSAGNPSLGRFITLEQGDLLVIDNRRAAHGRSAFAASFGGTDRWVQRVYVQRSGGTPHRIRMA
jgi:L-asparagine oxygenase